MNECSSRMRVNYFTYERGCSVKNVFIVIKARLKVFPPSYLENELPNLVVIWIIRIIYIIRYQVVSGEPIQYLLGMDKKLRYKKVWFPSFT